MLGAFYPTFQVCVVSATLVQFFANDNPELARNLDNILCLFNPLYPLMACLNCITKVGKNTVCTIQMQNESRYRIC